MTVHGGTLRGMRHELAVASAQVKTAILLAGLQAEGRTTVDVPADASSAAFLVVAALVLPDSEVRLPGVLLSPTRAASTASGGVWWTR
jgi:3-phosphoshikimate 1-carboxyvinyltransferase